MRNKLISSVLALLMFSSMAVPSFAEAQSSPITVSTEASIMNVTVPTQLPIAVDENGESTVDTTAHIINNSAAQVEVTDVYVEVASDWTIRPWNTDWSKAALGLKEFAFKINNEEVDTDGSVDASKFGVIDGNGGSIDFTYAGRIAPQSGAINATLGNVVFILSWVNGEEVLPDVPEYKLSGTWVMNDVLSIDSIYDYDINFTSNDKTATAMSLYYYTQTLPSGSVVEETTLGYVMGDTNINGKPMATMVYTVTNQNSSQKAVPNPTNGWVDEAYRIVIFEEEQVVEEEFYNWFIANATKQ